MNPAPESASKGNMLDIIDQTIIPDPLNPQPGDVYARDIPIDPDAKVFKLSAESDITYRIVVRAVRTGPLPPFESFRISAARDGKQAAFTDATEFAATLASIPGMRPIGRIKPSPLNISSVRP